MSDPMTFQQFGPEFIKRVVTARLLTAKLQEKIGTAEIPISSDLAHGTARPRLGQITRVPKPALCDVTFYVPLQIDLTITVTALDSTFVGQATVDLEMVAETYEPAILYLRIRELDVSNVKYDAEPKDPIGRFIRAVWPAWDMFRAKVEATVKETLDKRLDESEEAREIHFPVMVLEGTGGPDPARVPPILPPDSFIDNVLEPGAANLWAIALGEGETVQFKMYSACPAYEADARGELRILDGKKRLESDEFSTTTWGKLGDFNLEWSTPFTAPKTGVYHVEVVNREPKNGQPIRYKLAQVRTRRDRGTQVCFNDFGQGFMRHVISVPLIERKIVASIPSQMPFTEEIKDPFGLTELGKATGTAEINLIDVDALKGKPNQELTFRIRLSVEAKDIHVQLLAGKERWLVRTEVTFYLRVRPEEPLVLHVSVDSLTDSSVKIVETKLVDGAGLFNLFGLLAGRVADGIRQKVQTKLGEQKETLSQDIEKEAEKTVQAALAAAQLPPPAQFPMGVIPVKPGTEQVFEHRFGQGVPFFGILLEENQSLKLTTTMALKAGEACSGSVAVLDLHFGHLPTNGGGFLACTPLDSFRKDKAVVQFEPEQAGVYLFRARLDPSAGDDRNAKVSFTIKADVLKRKE